MAGWLPAPEDHSRRCGISDLLRNRRAVAVRWSCARTACENQEHMYIRAWYVTLFSAELFSGGRARTRVERVTYIRFERHADLERADSPESAITYQGAVSLRQFSV